MAADGSLDPRGPVAGEIADLWWVLLILGTAVLVVFAVVLAGALFRRRDPARTEGSGVRWIVAGGVVMPVVVLVVVFGFTVDSMRAIPTTAPRDALTVEIVGHQWWWEVRYPDHGIVTANEMHIPVGRPVEVRLTSADVIHSFWVPQLAGKLDLLPDGVNTLVLQADEPGEYRGQCAEFCGLQHAKMRFVAVATEPARFASWLANQQRPAAEPVDESTRTGRTVFLESGCAECHTIRGTPAAATKAPDLTHFASRRTIAAGTVPNTRRHLSEWVADPAAVDRWDTDSGDRPGRRRDGGVARLPGEPAMSRPAKPGTETPSVHEPETSDELNRLWADPPGWRGQLRAVQNDAIGKRLLLTGFFFLLLGGSVDSVVMRLQLARPDNDFIDAQLFNELFTNHGSGRANRAGGVGGVEPSVVTVLTNFGEGSGVIWRHFPVQPRWAPCPGRQVTNVSRNDLGPPDRRSGTRRPRPVRPGRREDR